MDPGVFGKLPGGVGIDPGVSGKLRGAPGIDPGVIGKVPGGVGIDPGASASLAPTGFRRLASFLNFLSRKHPARPG